MDTMKIKIPYVLVALVMAFLATPCFAQADYYERLANDQAKRSKLEDFRRFRFSIELEPGFQEAEVQSSDAKLGGGHSKHFTTDVESGFLIEAEYRFTKTHGIYAKFLRNQYGGAYAGNNLEWAGAVIPSNASIDADVDLFQLMVEYRFEPEWLVMSDTMSFFLGAGFIWEKVDIDFRVPSFPLFVEDQSLDGQLPYPFLGLGGRWQLGKHLFAYPLVRYGYMPEISGGDLPEGGSGKQSSSLFEIRLTLDLDLFKYLTVGTSVGYTVRMQELKGDGREISFNSSEFFIFSLRLGVVF